MSSGFGYFSSSFVPNEALFAFALGQERNLSSQLTSLASPPFSPCSTRDATIGIVRSNFLVPTTLPVYYFEVTVVEDGKARPEESAWSIAVGMWTQLAVILGGLC